MISATDWIGTPVFERSSGRRLGKIRDIIVDKSWRVYGFLLAEKLWFSPARYIRWEDVAVFGLDSWFLHDRQAIKPFRPKEHPPHHFLRRGDTRILGVPLLTDEGIYAGRVEDVYFSPKMEDFIVGFELSEGLLLDLREGRKRVALPHGAERGDDVILVSSESLQEADRLTIDE